MEGIWVADQQSANIANTLQLRDGNHFWLSMGYNFGCVVASGTIFDLMGGFSGSSYPMKT